MSCGAIIVETRPLPDLIAIIDGHRSYLPAAWGLRVYCGPANVEHLRLVCRDVVELPRPITSKADYNALMTSGDFWERVPFDHVLVFQYDSRLLRAGVENFHLWDWVGAPWPALEGGNGGLSLRSRQFMLDAVANAPWNGRWNEDVYFCQQAKKLGARLAPREVCEVFSCESIFRLGTVGCHAIERWHSPEQVEQILTQYEGHACAS